MKTNEKGCFLSAQSWIQIQIVGLNHSSLSLQRTQRSQSQYFFFVFEGNREEIFSIVEYNSAHSLLRQSKNQYPTIVQYYIPLENKKKNNMETPSSHPTRSKSTRIHKRLKRKQLAQKQNGFVLDCLNQQTSSLKSYNSISDKFLNYFVIRVHPNAGKTHKKMNSIAKVTKLEQIESQNHNRFQDMLKREKEKYTPLARGMHHKMETEPKTIQQVEESRQRGPETEKIKIEDFENSIKYKEKRESVKETPKKQNEKVVVEQQ